MYLQLKQLVKEFAGRGGPLVRAVDDVTLDIEKGDLVTLLGPSGCGKTTTLRLIAGFEFPTAGEIVLDGRQINDTPPNRREMSMVFQSYAIFPHLTVFENIAYGLRIKRLTDAEIRRRVGTVLDLVALSGLENRQPNQLSGGQQQRVALARALVMEPKVLLFDEPLSNLDAKLRLQMRTEIRRIQQQLKITSVYVTHDQDEAMILSDRIVVMNYGRVQQVGTAVEIYRRPANRFVADFIGRANFLPVAVQSANGRFLDVTLYDVTLQVPQSEHHQFRPGDPATLLVRPEAIHVQPAPDGEQMAIPGQVRRTAYLGSLSEYDIEVYGSLVAAVHHSPTEADLYPPGSDVYLALRPENLYLLPTE
jgi:iron(III) transport system ATP-binding protein